MRSRDDSAHGVEKVVCVVLKKKLIRVNTACDKGIENVAQIIVMSLDDVGPDV